MRPNGADSASSDGVTLVSELPGRGGDEEVSHSMKTLLHSEVVRRHCVTVSTEAEP